MTFVHTNFYLSIEKIGNIKVELPTMKTANQFLSSFLPEVSRSLSSEGSFVCAYLAELPFDIFDDSHKICLNTLVNSIFNLNEKEAWYSSGSKKYRVHRILGRLVAKDAVRFYLKEHYDIKISPVDILIDNDQSGKPEVSVIWPNKLPGAIKLSLAHKEGVAVALAGESQTATGVGIDIEPVRPLRKYFLEGAFTEKEFRLAAGLDKQAEEWLVRMWCAKEAIGKALGTGIVYSPKEIVVVGLDTDSKRIDVELSGGRLQQFHQFSGKKLSVVTFRKEKMAIAVTAI
ncbi:MAG: 4'-phosphopantetheinyl transferase superfamily protein [Candidatus Ratteibacteria bacterium]|jgi:phosphopantetheine--protein transferase-like protein